MKKETRDAATPPDVSRSAGSDKPTAELKPIPSGLERARILRRRYSGMLYPVSTVMETADEIRPES